MVRTPDVTLAFCLISLRRKVSPPAVELSLTVILLTFVTRRGEQEDLGCITKVFFSLILSSWSRKLVEFSIYGGCIIFLDVVKELSWSAD